MTDTTRQDVIRVLHQRLARLNRAGLTRIPAPGASLPEMIRETAAEARPEPPAATVPTPTPPPAEPRAAQTRPVATAMTAASLFETPVPNAPVMDLEARREALATLEAEVAACLKCPQLASSRTQTVFGVGNPGAKLMFIGEAPGADEDRQGEPFVGRAGQLLTDMITKGMNLQRSDVYIANILKCRPPSNRDPMPDEAANCLPYLERQIEILRPEHLCLLGRVAAQTLLETALPMSRLRGRWHRYRNIPTIVTYHPAALLRNPAWKRETWEDLQMLMRAMGLKLPNKK